MRLVVRVKPNARRNALSFDEEGRLVASVAAPPREGAANDAVRRVIAEALGLTLRQITLERGAAARLKTFALHGVDESRVAAVLAGLRAPTDGRSSTA